MSILSGNGWPPDKGTNDNENFPFVRNGEDSKLNSGLSSNEKKDASGYDYDDVIPAMSPAMSNQKNILLDGKYKFIVDRVEKGRFKGSTKIAPCNKVTLYMHVDTPQGIVNVKTDIILSHILDWKIRSFYVSIGYIKETEDLTMNWNQAVDAEGYALFHPRNYDYEGKNYTVNDIVKYLSPAEAAEADEAKTDEKPEFSAGPNRNY